MKKVVNGIDIECSPQEEAEILLNRENFRIQEELYESTQGYKDKRKLEYPDMQDQLDMLYHDLKNGTTIWRDLIDSIKKKYPKPVK